MSQVGLETLAASGAAIPGTRGLTSARHLEQ